MQENKVAIEAMSAGIAKVVPLVQLRAFYTWEEFERSVCGGDSLDLERLKEHTRFQGPASDEQEQLFWSVLEDFTNEQQSAFLSFVWGRERLPPVASDESFEMCISFQQLRAGQAKLPIAHTCSFELELPICESKARE